MSDQLCPLPRNAAWINFLHKARFAITLDEKELNQHDWLYALFRLAKYDDSAQFDFMTKKYGRLHLGGSMQRGRPAKIKDNAGVRAEAAAIGKHAAKVLAKKHGVHKSTIDRHKKKAQ